MTPEQESTLLVVYQLQSATRKHVQECQDISRSAAHGRLMDLLDHGYIERRVQKNTSPPSHWFEITDAGVEALFDQYHERWIRVTDDHHIFQKLLGSVVNIRKARPLSETGQI